MKIGMIGIGDIAKKAYLPILATRSDIQLSIASRNQETVQQIAQQYRITNAHTSITDLIHSGIDAAFVHTATPSHPEIVRQLIEAGIQVLVDKPIANTLRETEDIVSFAKQRGVGLMVGFNRRFAPMYRRMKEDIQVPETILMQKNRTGPLSNVRDTVFDDYIHVVDTLLYYLGKPTDVSVHAKVIDEHLHYVALNLNGNDTTAIGIMHRQTGTTEEQLEVMGEQKKLVVSNMVHTTSFVDNAEQQHPFGDWTTTLYRRGFVDMIDHFITCVRSGVEFETSGEKSLLTHQICEQITEKLSK